MTVETGTLDAEQREREAASTTRDFPPLTDAQCAKVAALLTLVPTKEGGR